MALGTELRHLSYLGPWNTLYLMILALYILRHFNLFHPLPKFSMHLFRFAWSSEKLQLNENDFNYTSKCDDLHNLKNTPPRNAFSILKIKTKFAFQGNMETATQNHNNIHNLSSNSHNSEIYPKAINRIESNHYI